MRCPAAPICESMYPDIQTEAARIGTNAHKWAEEVLTGVLSFNDVPFEYRAIEAYVAYVQELQASCLNEVYIEQRVTIPCIRGWGTIDTLVIRPQEAEIIDLKYGRIPVGIDNNCQLILYALGYLSRGIHEGLDIHKVKLTIIQPNSSDGVTYRSKTYSVAELMAMQNYFKSQADKIFEMRETGILEYLSGEQCTWCRHRYNCKECGDYLTGYHSHMFGF